MTGYEAITLLVSTAALTAVGASVIFYHRQVEEMRRQNTRLSGSLRITTTDVLQAGFLGVVTAYLENPRLRCVFYEDEAGPDLQPLGNDDLLRANALAEWILSVFASGFRLSAEEDAVILPWYDAFVRDSFLNSDHLLKYALRRRAWIDPRVIAIADVVASELQGHVRGV